MMSTDRDQGAEIKRFGVNPRTCAATAHNSILYVAGQVARRCAGAPVAEQTHEILQSIDEILADAGTDKSRILSVTLYLTDVASLDEVNSIWTPWIVQGFTPARTTVQAVLAAPGYDVEIAMIVAL
jgi:enamine deaminase RidA (YjgF/YER057c/UK114 family)